MANRLALESSPYLLQHANNPVDWYAWGPEALQRARTTNRPIFLSIGYSACHWCHVMEHESFESAEIAAQLNAHFVCIKVDREERPDLDHIYMQAVQMLTGHGGWPMSVFLTPDLRPFFGGTYWPEKGRMGMPGFDQVLDAVLDFWTNQRGKVDEQARTLTNEIRALGEKRSAGGELSASLLDRAGQALERSFDSAHGGFGTKPKFPHGMDLRLLLRLSCRDPRPSYRSMAELTLDKMAAGGLYDQLAGGFHRYSVDEHWLVPHFEKMLYDNALLATTYLEAYQLFGHDSYQRVVRETLDYLLREMTDPAGGFYSTQDADSEGEEGKFYVWTLAEIREVLGAEAGDRFALVYDVTEVGNFEGTNILNMPQTVEQVAKQLRRDPAELQVELEHQRERLLAVRASRVAPGLDDKVLVSWNALAIEAFALAGSVLESERYTNAAVKAAEFVFAELTTQDGRLLHSWRHGTAKLPAYLDDYAYLTNAVLTLYEATFDERWIERAVTLADQMLARFADPAGGFFFTADDHEELFTRHKDSEDGSVPSGTSMAATALLRLGKFTGQSMYIDAAEQTLRGQVHLMERYPTAAGQSLLALDAWCGPYYECVLTGPLDQPATQHMRRKMQQQFIPRRLLALRSTAETNGNSTALAGLFAGRTPSETPSFYLCQGFTCDQPLTEPAAVAKRLATLSQASGVA